MKKIIFRFCFVHHTQGASSMYILFLYTKSRCKRSFLFFFFWPRSLYWKITSNRHASIVARWLDDTYFVTDTPMKLKKEIERIDPTTAKDRGVELCIWTSPAKNPSHMDRTSKEKFIIWKKLTKKVKNPFISAHLPRYFEQIHCPILEWIEE